MSPTAVSKPKKVLVTGGSGHVGAMVIDQLLKEDYNIRAVVRPPKVSAVRATYPGAGDKLEVVEIRDIVMDDWSPFLSGVDAVIHVAAPLYQPGTTSKQIYDGSVNGTEKLVEAVGKSSVKRFVFTCSVGALFKPDFSNIFTDVTFDENTWSDLDSIEADELDPSAAYVASKAISEKIVWRAASKYPNVDFTTILPPCIYGAFLPHYPTPKHSDDLNANKFIYEIFQKEKKFPHYPNATLVHNRDVAKAHVNALTAPPLTDGRKKRLLLCAGQMTWVDTINYIREKRPAVADRLPDTSLAGPQSVYKMDTSLAAEVIGIGPKEYVSWQDMLLEVVDYLMEWEKSHTSA